MRAIGKIGLALALAAGAAAKAAPMSAKDYQTRVQQEVNFQNLTCFQLGEAKQVLDELFTCPPTQPFDSFDSQVTSILEAQQSNEGATKISQRQAAQATDVNPGRRCGPSKLRPSFPLTTALYDDLGPVAQAELRTAGVPRDMDLDNDQLHGIPRSMPELFAPAVVNDIESNIDTAIALRNCQG